MAATNTAAMNAFMFFAPITSEYLSSTERRCPAEQDPPSSNSQPYLDRGAWQPCPWGVKAQKSVRHARGQRRPHFNSATRRERDYPPVGMALSRGLWQFAFQARGCGVDAPN